MEENDKTREIEHWLDAGLKHYAAVEPRAGLENRVLATIRTEHARPYRLGEWRLRFVLAVVVVTGALLFLKQRAPKGASHPGDEDSASSVQIEIQGQMQPAESKHQAGNFPGASTLRTHPAPRNFRSRIEASVTEPRLEQFPSPQPLTEQEEMLARYVRDRRQEALMVARARAALENREFLPATQQLPSVVPLPDSQE
jgi:hypothetical protein